MRMDDLCEWQIFIWFLQNILPRQKCNQLIIEWKECSDLMRGECFFSYFLADFVHMWRSRQTNVTTKYTLCACTSMFCLREHIFRFFFLVIWRWIMKQVHNLCTAPNAFNNYIHTPFQYATEFKEPKNAHFQHKQKQKQNSNVLLFKVSGLTWVAGLDIGVAVAAATVVAVVCYYLK